MNAPIRHHPDDGLLLKLATGHLPAAAALVVATHAELCPRCAARLRQFESLGGVLLDAAAPAELSPQAFARTLERIDAENHRAVAAPRRAPRRPRPPLPDGLRWPASLEACEISGWRWFAPGMRWARVRLPQAPEANSFLLRMAAGKRVAAHGHRGLELTQVLYGAFDDGHLALHAGDFEAADERVAHRPVVLEEGGECVCLASLDGRLQFEGWLGRLLGRSLTAEAS